MGIYIPARGWGNVFYYLPGTDPGGAGGGVHSWGRVSPFKMHYSITFKYQAIIGRPPLGEILYPPLITEVLITEPRPVRKLFPKLRANDKRISWHVVITVITIFSRPGLGKCVLFLPRFFCEGPSAGRHESVAKAVVNNT